jgi:hypothetical protein
MVLPQTLAALALPGAPGASVAILQALNVDPAVIEQIATMLNNNHDTVMKGKPVGTKPSAFGQSGAGTYLAHHTSVAERHVAEAMVEMAEALTGYRKAIKKFADDAEETDLAARDDLRRLTERVQGARITDPGGDR